MQHHQYSLQPLCMRKKQGSEKGVGERAKKGKREGVRGGSEMKEGVRLRQREREEVESERRRESVGRREGDRRIMR